MRRRFIYRREHTLPAMYKLLMHKYHRSSKKTKKQTKEKSKTHKQTSDHANKQTNKQRNKKTKKTNKRCRLFFWSDAMAGAIACGQTIQIKRQQASNHANQHKLMNLTCRNRPCSTNSKSHPRACGSGCVGVVRGVGGLIVYHLRAPQNIHWKKMYMGDSLISNLLSCLLEGRKEGEF